MFSPKWVVYRQTPYGEDTFLCVFNRHMVSNPKAATRFWFKVTAEFAMMRHLDSLSQYCGGIDPDDYEVLSLVDLGIE